MISAYKDLLEEAFVHLTDSPEWASTYAQIGTLVTILLASLLISYLCKQIVVPTLLKMVNHTHTKWDDYFINEPVMNAVCQLIPSLLILELLPHCLEKHFTFIYTTAYRLTQAYIAYSCTTFISAFLKNLTVVTTEVLKGHHLIGILQFLRLIVFFLGGIVMLSLLFGHNPVRVIAGLGAAATVLMLIFKDSILGLVAGIQLSKNDMLKIGDWITIKKLDIDGTVEELSLTTIKVRNFDNTISTIPPYTLVCDSFQNWRGMFNKGLRRVKKELHIDLNTVVFASDELKETLKRKKLISKADAENKQITNLTLFRHYVLNTLQEEQNVSNSPWILARQLNPTPQGLPFQICFYTPETSFIRFEDIASELTEHFIAMLPAFELRHYQTLSGTELAHILSGK